PRVAACGCASASAEGPAGGPGGWRPGAAAGNRGVEVQNLRTGQVVREGKVAPAVVRALEDSLAVRRGAAAEALARRGGSEHRPALRKLLEDTDPGVRLRVGLALVGAGDREAVPALIEGLTGFPQEQAGQAEEALR